MKRFALFLAIIAGILWGSTGPFVRLLYANGMSNVTVFFSRVCIASIILFVGLMIYDRSLFRIKLKDIWLFIMTGCFAMTGLNICYNVSIIHMSLSLAAVLLALSPIYVVIIAAFLFKEKVTAKKVICMVLAIVGCILVSGVLEARGELTLTTFGVLIGILSGVLYAFYFVFSRIAGERGYNTFTIIFYSMLFATILLIIPADLPAIGAYIKAAPAPHIGILIIHSLLSSVLPYIFVTIAIMHAEAGVVSILGAAGEPAAATVFGLIFFSEYPSALSWAGLILTIIALSLLLSPERKKTGV